VAESGEVRVPVRVRPGASRTAVGGAYGDGSPPRLVVAVGARAVDGAATEAARRALAEALEVPLRRVRLVTGATSRDKVFAVAVANDDDRARLAERVRAQLR
jgi:uncharacterized protein